MPRWINITLKVLGGLLAIIIIFWLGAAAYVQSNKKELLEKITSQLNEDLNGKISIEKMEPALLRGFPGVSVSLKNVLLRDSLWEKHRHDLLKATDLYVAIDVFSIIKGTPSIKKINIHNGSIYLFTDSNGYSNSSLFKKKGKKPAQGNGGNKRINQIDFEQVSLVIENQRRRKYYNLMLNKVLTNIKYSSDGWKGKTRLDAFVKSLTFNTKNGSFLKDKKISANIDLSFDENTGVLTLPAKEYQIGDDELSIGANFGFSEKTSAFGLEIVIPKITLKNGSSLLAKNISGKINRYSLKEPLSAKASITGDLKSPGDPKVLVQWETQNNTVVFNGMTVSDASFRGLYTNEIIEGKGRNDANSHISFYKLSGNYAGIPFKADTINIINLKAPLISGRFAANFPLTKLNNLLGGKTFSFSSGNASLNLLYRAPFDPNDNGSRYILGDVKVSNVSAKYLPRNVKFTNGNVRLNFTGRDLRLENMRLRSGDNTLQMNGLVKNLSNFYYSDPRKIVIDWNIYSPQINLNDFMGFVGIRNSSGAKPSAGKKPTVDNLENLLDQASARVKLNVDKMIFKSFSANNLRGDINLNQRGLTLNNASLNHAGGSFKVSGTLYQGAAVNSIKLKTTISNANVKELFYSFEDFGQDAITSRNLRGSLDANTDISASIKNDGTILPRSIAGTVKFKLKNGAIVNFEPMEKVGSFAFKNRNFSNISFKNLENTLSFNGNSVNIPPMQIESSVLNIFLQGVYGFSSGTNISLSIPLRNPEKDIMITNKAEKRERATKGIVINLHAVDGDDGKVKFKLGKGD